MWGAREIVERDGPRVLARHRDGDYDAWCADCDADIIGVPRRRAEDWLDQHHCKEGT